MKLWSYLLLSFWTELFKASWEASDGRSDRRGGKQAEDNLRDCSWISRHRSWHRDLLWHPPAISGMQRYLFGVLRSVAVLLFTASVIINNILYCVIYPRQSLNRFHTSELALYKLLAQFKSHNDIFYLSHPWNVSCSAIEILLTTYLLYIN